MRLGWNSAPQARAAKISKTTPCKVAGGCRRSTRPLDTSGNSGVFFQYSEIVCPPRLAWCAIAHGGRDDDVALARFGLPSRLLAPVGHERHESGERRRRLT